MTASAARPRSALFFVAMPLVCFAALPLAAQVTSGSIVGSVRDSSGGVIPGATITLIRITKGTTTETTTNESGDFTFPNAPGDTYTVRVTMDGFKTLERPNVPLTPG